MLRDEVAVWPMAIREYKKFAEAARLGYYLEKVVDYGIGVLINILLSIKSLAANRVNPVKDTFLRFWDLLCLGTLGTLRSPGAWLGEYFIMKKLGKLRLLVFEAKGG